MFSHFADKMNSNKVTWQLNVVFFFTVIDAWCVFCVEKNTDKCAKKNTESKCSGENKHHTLVYLLKCSYASKF